MCVRALFSIAAMIASAGAVAEDFRFETFVFVGDAEEHDSRSVSLFHQGVYYDLQGKERPSTIYSPPIGNRPGRFILLDPVREVRTEFTSDRIDAFVTKYIRWALAQQDADTRFWAAPEFDIQYDDGAGQLTLASAVLTYDIDTQPLKSEDRARVLVEFFDSFTKLNCLTNRRLPGPRLAVNRELLSRQIAPTEIRFAFDDIDEPDLRSEHKLAWLLAKDDLDAIAVLNEQMVTFRAISNDEYHRNLTAQTDDSAAR